MTTKVFKNETDPTFYGLSTRIQLEALSLNKLGIRKVIKSRIIRKDAEKIVEIAHQIKSVTPYMEVTLICTRNICSKSIDLLKKEGIGIEYSSETE
ncbi:MAG: hypothetical protein JXR27_04490 [Paludibacteraceae bacterium]|nr:hypothetical protein [Paludibacteraceae bacterium]